MQAQCATQESTCANVGWGHSMGYTLDTPMWTVLSILSSWDNGWMYITCVYG